MTQWLNKFTHWSKGQWAESLLVLVLVAMMGTQLTVGAQSDGVTFDEPIHLLSGYTFLTQQHMVIDPEHPPLAKAWSALPLLWIQPHLPQDADPIAANLSTLKANTYSQANGWGWQLLFKSGNDPYQLLSAGRMMTVIMTLAAAVVLWLWSRQLFGKVAGIATLALFSFDPTILAHGHYINTDLGATFLYIASLASLWQFLTKRQLQWLVTSGLVVGLALLTKFSLIVLLGLVPMLVIAWLIYHHGRLGVVRLDWLWIKRLEGWLVGQGQGWSKWWNQTRLVWLMYAVVTVGMMALAIGVVWLVYGSLWLINPAQNTLWALANGSPIGSIWAFLPGMYAKGLSVIGGNRSGYLLNECYKGSKWDYFLVLTWFKMPVGSLVLVGLAGLSAALAVGKRLTVSRWPFIVWYLGLAIGVFYGFSMFAGVNIGLRHVLPAYTLLLIPAGYVVAKLWHGSRKLVGRQKWWGGLGLVLISWVALASFMTWPYYLPYYNELSGEPHNRPWVADDSNTDWGEGTRALAGWVKEQGIKQIALDNFNGWTEAQYLGTPVVAADSANTDYKGYIALSRSSIVYNYCRLDYSWSWLIEKHEPVAIVGGSINVYYLE